MTGNASVPLKMKTAQNDIERGLTQKYAVQVQTIVIRYEFPLLVVHINYTGVLTMTDRLKICN